jgi:glucose/arabinose dehydrogenase
MTFGVLATTGDLGEILGWHRGEGLMQNRVHAMTADPPHDQRVIVRRHFLIVVLFAATLWRLHSAPVLANVTPDSETVVPEDDPEEGDGVALTPVAGPLEHPWSIAFLGDRTILVTERPGRLRIIDHDGLRPEEIKGVPEVLTGGHAGLFDIALDPNFVHNRHLYISYVHGTVEAATVRVMRARFTGTSLVDRWVIYETPRSAAGLEQFGGRLAFGGDGMLYLTLGDRIQMERAQDLGDPWGKILRLYSDGRAPADNPFVGTPGALPEIWTYGHRNPQGLAFDPQTGRLWAHEHAPQGGDELISCCVPATMAGRGSRMAEAMITSRSAWARLCREWSRQFITGCPRSHRQGWRSIVAKSSPAGPATSSWALSSSRW